MKNNYFLGIILALIFPGLIQYYVSDSSKGSKYIVLYFLSFVSIFILLSLQGNTIDIHSVESLGRNALLIQLSMVINIIFRLISGIDGLLQIRKNRMYF